MTVSKPQDPSNDEDSSVSSKDSDTTSNEATPTGTPLNLRGGILPWERGSNSSPGKRVNNPTSLDILLGRGKPVQSHSGNQRMLSIVDENRARYLDSERKVKHQIIEEILKSIKASGGRFLTRVDYENYWVEVNHAVAYRKVGHAFRSKARLKSGCVKRRADLSMNKTRDVSDLATGLVNNGVGVTQLARSALSLGPGAAMASPSHLVLGSGLVIPTLSYPTVYSPAVELQAPLADLRGRMQLRTAGSILNLNHPLNASLLSRQQPALGIANAPARGMALPMAGFVPLDPVLARSQVIDSLSANKMLLNGALGAGHYVTSPAFFASHLGY